jgi:hypothetical protein
MIRDKVDMIWKAELISRIGWRITNEREYFTGT